MSTAVSKLKNFERFVIIAAVMYYVLHQAQVEQESGAEGEDNAKITFDNSIN